MDATTPLPTYRLERDHLTRWIDSLIAEGKRVIGPVDRRGMRVVREVSRAQDLTFAAGKTRWSPKEFLFPRTEPLFSYRKEGDDVRLSDPVIPDTPQVLFAVRPCDAAGIVRLDGILLQDAFYANRRQRTTVVAFACAEAEPACFCTAVGGSPAGKDGVDVLIGALGEGWALRVLTPKGEALVAAARADWSSAAPGDWDRVEEEAAKVGRSMSRREIPAAWAEALEKSFNDPLWNDLAQRCVGCSICAYVCPSCSCFDVADQGNDSCGTRCRTWDSCSFRLFTQHGSGHNPRPDQASRSRQRVLHKFAYYPLQHEGHAMCVGCGRCIELCPVGMDIHEEAVSVMSPRPSEEAKDAQG